MALRGTLTHRKTRRLASKLGVELPMALGVLEALWHVTSRHTPRGDIGRLSNQDIADEMWYSGDADALIEILIETGWIDEHKRHRLLVHDWPIHADSHVRSRVGGLKRGWAVNDPEDGPELNPDGDDTSEGSTKGSTRVGEGSGKGRGRVHQGSGKGEARVGQGSPKGGVTPEPEPVPEPATSSCSSASNQSQAATLAIETILRERGVRASTAPKLAGVAAENNLTPAEIYALAETVPANSKSPTGLLVKRIRDGDRPPPPEPKQIAIWAEAGIVTHVRGLPAEGIGYNGKSVMMPDGTKIKSVTWADLTTSYETET